MMNNRKPTPSLHSRRKEEEENSMMDKMGEEKTMRDGTEADILQISVVLHEVLQRLESFVSLSHIKEKELDPSPRYYHYWGDLRALQRTLYMLQDVVDVETSLEKRVIDHLKLGKLDGMIFKGEQVSVAAERSAAMPTWLRAVRVALNDTILALEKIYAQVSLSQAQGLRYFLDGYNDEEEETNSAQISFSEEGKTIISLDIHGFTFPTKKKIIHEDKPEIFYADNHGFAYASQRELLIHEIVTKQRDDPHGHTSILSCISLHKRELANLISQGTPPVPQRIETPQLAGSSSSNDDVYGREEDKRKVIESVVSDLEKSTASSSSCSEDIIHVMSIVSGPGVGKTTLAKLVYNDVKIDNCFDMKMWVSMSNCYSDIIRTTQYFVKAATMAVAIVGEATVSEAPREETSDQEVVSIVGEASDTSSSSLALVPDSSLALAIVPYVGEVTVPDSSSSVLAHLQLLLEKLLHGKKFLLVLDGVSNEICCDWEVLRVPLRVGAANGSRILITSRSFMVSSRLGTIFSYTLRPLLYKDCWSLVRDLTFGRNSGITTNTPPHPPPGLSQYIEMAAELLQGFPSLAVSLGTFLHSIQQKNKVQTATEVILSSYASTCSLSISLTMLWAYHSLSSPQLKQCFVFCGSFRKRYRFKKSRLIKLWMAEGFLQTTKESDIRMEDLGVSYLEELMERSLFEHPRDSPYFMLPEAVHDLAQYIFNNRALKMYTDSISKSFRSDHHSTLCSVINSEGQGHHKYRFYNTFLSMVECQTCMNHIPRDLFQNLVGLRVLDLSNCRLTLLPDSIRYLEHLRFLDLSRNRIEYLPECVSTLHFLQTLKIKSIYHILEFPKNMEMLLNMRHLYLGFGYRSFPMPVGIGKVTNLQSLRAFSVGTERDEFGRIEELRELRYLRGSLTILNLENVEKECNGGWLLDKDLQKLQLKWNHMVDNEIAENLLASLQPRPTLKHLTIISYGGLRFPAWIGNPTFSNLKTIELKRCNRCEFLPPLGLLPLLETLHLYKMNSLKCIDGGFCGNENEKFRKLKIFLGLKRNMRFPKLKVLELKKLYGLEKWTGLLVGDMPLLEELSIINCDMLISLPNLKNLGSLRELKFVNVKKLQMLPKEGLPSSLEELDIEGCPLLYKSCSTAGNEDWSKVKAVPHVTIGGRDFFSPTLSCTSYQSDVFGSSYMPRSPVHPSTR